MMPKWECVHVCARVCARARERKKKVGGLGPDPLAFEEFTRW